MHHLELSAYGSHLSYLYLKQHLLKTIDIFENLYGIFDIEFQSEMLSQGKIGVNRVSGVSPDGTIFKAPDEDFLPEPLEIKSGIQAGAVIVLKIPKSEDTVAR